MAPPKRKLNKQKTATKKPLQQSKTTSMPGGKVDNAKKLIIDELKKPENKKGLHWKEIISVIQAKDRSLPVGTIGRAVRLLADEKKYVENTGWGLYRHKKYIEEEIKEERIKAPNEEKFYEPFAIWLRLEQEECDKTVVYGKKRREKWMTPDVIGRKEKTIGGVINLPPEITSAEIKSAVQYQQLIQGFGQACAYKLFSHYVYLVVPEQTPQKYLYRIDKLCFKFGVGLVTYDRDIEDTSMISFKLLNRPQYHEPDTQELMRIIDEVEWDKAEAKEDIG